MDKQLFVTVHGPAVWFVVGDCSCQVCCVPLLQVGFFSAKWERGVSFDLKFFCRKCLPQRVSFGHVDLPSGRVRTLFGTMQVVDSVPVGVRPWVPYPLDFVDGRLTCTEAAFSGNDSKIVADTSGSVVRDRTVLSGRESFEGVSVGSPDMYMLERKDAVLRSVEQGFSLLDDLSRSSDALADGTNKKLLDDTGDKK